MKPPGPNGVVAIVCLAEILSMTPFSMFLALQPLFRDEWRLSNTASGWVSSAYFAGYMLAVPLLSSLTDRIDARRVWLAACATAGAGALGYALYATGVWTAAFFQVIAGAGLAGTYMPGLKLLADRLPTRPTPRHVAFYTTSFTLGSSLSFWVVGTLGSHVAWQLAIAATALGPAAAWLLLSIGLRPVPVHSSPAENSRGHWKSVLRSADSMRYVAGYAAHVWELFALRAWLVPFVTFVATARGSASPVSAATLAALVALIGVPASIAGAELIGTFQRRRLIVGVMLLSVMVSILVAPAALFSWLLVIGAVCLYSAFISADSAALTSGILDVAPPASRGTAMAVYSTLGFAAASAGTFAVGALLDLLGGESTFTWTLAFVMMGAPNIVGIVAISRASR